MVDRRKIRNEEIGRCGAACFEIGRDRGKSFFVATCKYEAAPPCGAPARVGLCDRGGRPENEDTLAHAASAVTRRQKSDMMAGSRCASTVRHAGYPARNACPDMVASLAG